MTAASGQRVRIDKWLWAARFYKTRSIATQAIEAGKVEVNGERVKPARDVHPGDRLELRIGQATWELEVLGLATQRGPASVAQTLYRESDASRARRAEASARRRIMTEPTAELKGRPTKRDRRNLERFQGGDAGE